MSPTRHARQPGTISVTYLELSDPESLRPPATPAPRELGTRVVRDYTRNRDLYTRVGADYSWIDRLGWSDRQWRAWAQRVETHLVELRGKAIGYYELEVEPSSAKIAIFGLLGGYHGRGLGGHALTAALRRGLRAAAQGLVDHLLAGLSRRASQLPRPRARGVQGRAPSVGSPVTLSAQQPASRAFEPGWRQGRMQRLDGRCVCNGLHDR